MNGLIVGALMALSMVQQTDTIIDVGSAEKVNVETLGGSIHVEVWEENRVRIQAEHSNRTYIEIENGSREIEIEAEARRGPANIVDFRLTVPRRLALELEAQYGDITIEGSDGAVQAETLQGDVTIVGGRGMVEVEATTGSIYVEGADGQIEIESSAADIHVVRSTGEIYAETAGGTIVLEDVSPRAVDVGSTGGRVHYDGTFEPGGTYFFGAHGGSITIVVGEEAQASFNVATVHGSITSNLRGEAEGFRGGRRHEFEIGGGGAIVEAETYGGRIRLLRRGTEGSAAPTPRRNRANEAGQTVAFQFDRDWQHEWAWETDWAGDHEWAWEMDWGPEADWGWDVDIDVDDVDVDVDHEWADEDDWDMEWVGELGRGIASAVSAAVAPVISAEVAPVISAEVAPRISAVVAPRVRAELAPLLELAIAPEVGIARPPATIRR